MGKKVAVIEDEPAISDLYVMKLSSMGYEVKAASNGKEGFTLVEKFKPDLILLDLMMPIVTGEEMLKQLRKTDWGKDMKVMILTNVSRQDAPESLDKLGVQKYIIKAYYTASQVADLVKEEIGN